MNTPETKEKRRNSHLGKHLTEAAKEKIRQANLGNTKGSIVVYQYSKDKSVFIKE